MTTENMNDEKQVLLQKYLISTDADDEAYLIGHRILLTDIPLKVLFEANSIFDLLEQNIRQAKEYEKLQGNRAIDPDIYLPLLQLFGAMFAKWPSLVGESVYLDLYRELPFRGGTLSGAPEKKQNLMIRICENMSRIEAGDKIYSPSIDSADSIIQYILGELQRHFRQLLKLYDKEHNSGLINRYIKGRKPLDDEEIDQLAAYNVKFAVIAVAKSLPYSAQLCSESYLSC